MRDDDELAAARALLPDWRLADADKVAGGSDRSAVYRVPAVQPDGAETSVIVKQFAAPGENWVREAAALGTLAGLGGTPRLIAAGAEAAVLILDDLGDGPSVADALLGDDPESARHAVISWAEAVATLHVRSRDQRADFGAELARRAGGAAVDESRTWIGLDDAVRVLDSSCGSLGVALPSGALDDLREIARRLGSDAPAALTPSDTCPDNNIFVGERLVLIDFEGAQWRHVAWDVAYLRVPWPTCWCSWAIPDAVTDEALAAYRRLAADAFPEVAGDDFLADVEAATVAWAFLSTTWFLDHALGGEQESDPPERSPSRRATILHRLHRAASSTEVPALAELAANLSVCLRKRWGDVPLELAPAFRG